MVEKDQTVKWLTGICLFSLVRMNEQKGNTFDRLHESGTKEALSLLKNKSANRKNE